jgi:membrane protease YdiL (CAAX protease family)
MPAMTDAPPPTPSREPFSRRDLALIGGCVALVAVCLFVILRYFSAAFPEASIEFKYDRQSSEKLARSFLNTECINVQGMTHAAEFDHDDEGKIFLERTVGLERANAVMKKDVKLWYWRHRWFRPLQEEEYAVHIAPSGEVIAYEHRIPEDRVIASTDAAAARARAEVFLRAVGVDVAQLDLVSESERALPKRVQRILTWESKKIRPGGAPYRYNLTVDGGTVSSYGQGIHVPDEWRRGYQELRSKNNAAGGVDSVFLIFTVIAMVAVFVIRLRRGDVQLRMILWLALAALVLSIGVALNSFPQVLAHYDTTQSWASFLTSWAVLSVFLQAIGAAMFLVVLAGSGEPLYRQRLPQHLALSRVWSRRALTSKRVFLSFVIGYTLVAFFIAYQVAFYLIADHFGAWSPAEIPYDDILNTAFPWVAVLFAGFYPAFSEELMSRAFSIPFFEKIFRSRLVAIVLAGFIWGFGHATYPNQPFYIRGLEVGFAGVIIGFLFYRFGLLPLLIWHFTVDALYTALLLFKSHNLYYIASAAVSALIFAIPMVISLILYFRNRGFVPDDDLTNAAVGSIAPPESVRVEETPAPLPPPIPVTRGKLVLSFAAVAIVALLVSLRPASIDDVVDYKVTKEEAGEIAAHHLTSLGFKKLPERRIVFTAAAFRSWDRSSSREEGGAPDGFDSVAAEYILRHGRTVTDLVNMMRVRVPAATWMVRFFTPMQKEEFFVEVDPRTRRVIGYHRYQDEKRPGARLERAAAEERARMLLPVYAIDGSALDLKEALTFQQPNRRDWLLHFEDRRPLAGQAVKRVTVRVAGDEVSQAAVTVKIPEADYRKASEETIVNTLFVVLKFAGVIALASLVIAGFVIATRKDHFRWRRAARWTALLAVIPILQTVAGYDKALLNYDTSVGWQTFVVGLSVGLFMRTFGQILLMFLAFAALDTALPFIAALFGRPGSRRFGRSAIVSAIAAVAIFAAVTLLFAIIEGAFPTLVPAGSPNIPSAVDTPFPALLGYFGAILRAIYGSAAVAMIVVALGAWEGRSRRWLPLIVTAALAASMLDSSANAAQIPLMLLSAVLLAVTVFCVVRYVLANNHLAYPLAFFFGSAISAAVPMLHQHRRDLHADGIALLAGALLLMVFFARGGGGIEEEELQSPG